MTSAIVQWLDMTGPEDEMNRIELHWPSITLNVPGVPNFEIQAGQVAKRLAARVYCIPGYQQVVLVALSLRLAQLGYTGINIVVSSPN